MNDMCQLLRQMGNGKIIRTWYNKKKNTFIANEQRTNDFPIQFSIAKKKNITK